MSAFMRRNSFLVFLVLLLAAFVAFGFLLSGWIAASSATSLRHELASLMNQTERLSEEIELEIAFMEQSLAPSAEEFLSRDGKAFAERWAEYHRQARFPGFLKAAYYFPLRSARPFRFSPEAGGFAEADDPLASAVQPFAAGDGSANANLAQELREALAASAGSDSYRVVPVTEVERQDQRGGPSRDDSPRVLRRYERSVGFLILALDDSVLAKEILPSLGRRYFGRSSGYGDFILRAVKAEAPDLEVALGPGDPPRRVDWSVNDFSRPLVPQQGRLNFYGLYSAAHARAEILGGSKSEKGPIEERMEAQIGLFRFAAAWGAGGWSIEAKHRSGSIQRAIALRSALETGLAAAFLSAAYALIAGLTLSSRRARILAERERDFIASVSHELKTPIAVILSASENMEKGIVGAERVGAYGAMLAKEGRRLRDSVEGILMVSGLQSAHHGNRSETFPLAELAREAASKMEDLAASRSARLAIVEEHRPIVKASKAMVGSALTSLMSNALKYGPEGGEVTVRVRAAGAAGRRRAEVSVEDRGPGLAYSERARVFDPFWRGNAASESGRAGTGLGLYLARRIARLHQGDVVFKPRQGGGACFVLSLPEEIEA